MDLKKKIVTLITAVTLAACGALHVPGATAETENPQSAVDCTNWRPEDFRYKTFTSGDLAGRTTITGFRDTTGRKVQENEGTVCFPDQDPDGHEVTMIGESNPNVAWNFYKKSTYYKEFDNKGIKRIGRWPEGLEIIEASALSHYYPKKKNSLEPGDLESIPSTWPPHLKQINDGAFVNNKLTEIPKSWPPELEKIGASAFSWNNLAGIPEDTWPPNLTEIGNYAFWHGNDSGRDNMIPKIPKFWSPKLKKLGEGAFWGAGLTEVPPNWPQDIETIEGFIFGNNVNLTCVAYVEEKKGKNKAFNQNQNFDKGCESFYGGENEDGQKIPRLFYQPASALSNAENGPQEEKTIEVDVKIGSPLPVMARFVPAYPFQYSEKRSDLFQCTKPEDLPSWLTLNPANGHECDFDVQVSRDGQNIAGSRKVLIPVNPKKGLQDKDKTYSVPLLLNIIDPAKLADVPVTLLDKEVSSEPALPENVKVVVSNDHQISVSDYREDHAEPRVFDLKIGNKTLTVDLDGGVDSQPSVVLKSVVNISADGVVLREDLGDLASSTVGVKVTDDVEVTISDGLITVHDSRVGELNGKTVFVTSPNGKKYVIDLSTEKIKTGQIGPTKITARGVKVGETIASDPEVPSGVEVTITAAGEISVTDKRTDPKNYGEPFQVKIGGKTFEVTPTKGPAVLKVSVVPTPGVETDGEVTGLPADVDVSLSADTITVIEHRSGEDNGKPFDVTIGATTYLVDPTNGTALIKSVVIDAPGVNEKDEVTGLPDGVTIAVSNGQITVTDDRTGKNNGEPFEVTIGSTRYLVDPRARTAAVLTRAANDQTGVKVLGVVAGLALLTLGLTAGLFMTVPGNGRDLVLKRHMMKAGLPECLADGIAAVMWKIHKFTLTPMAEDGDTDDDGLTDLEEREGKRNTAFGMRATNPFAADTDGDGVSDGFEIARGTDPNVKN